MNKRLVILPFAAASVLLLSACGAGAEGEAVSEEGELVSIEKKELEELVSQSKFEEEALYYREFVQELTSDFSKREMDEYIEKEWNYSIDVNGVNFPKDGELEIAAEKLTITVSEKRVPYSVIPLEESLKGKTLEKINYMVSIDGMTSREIAKDEREHTVQFEVADVQPGDTYELKIKEEMQERTGIKEDVLKITVKEGDPNIQKSEEQETETEGTS